MLNNAICTRIKNYFSSASIEIDNLISSGSLKEDIVIVPDNAPLSVASSCTTKQVYTDLATGQIYINSIYMNYIWNIVLSLVVNWQELIHYPTMEGTHGKDVLKNNEIKVQKMQIGLNHFELARRILTISHEWDTDVFLHPDYKDVDGMFDYVNKANSVYISTLIFIIFHEVGHVALNHFARRYECISANNFQGLKEIEIAADLYAIGKCQIDERDSMGITMIVGMIAALSSELFYSRSTTRREHPDCDRRLRDHIRKTVSDEKSEIYSIACIALLFWDHQYRIGLEWQENMDINYAELLDTIVDS